MMRSQQPLVVPVAEPAPAYVQGVRESIPIEGR
ncbi:MAG: hypothetical protein HW381_1893 [Candidatus Rokubacteria bacterium]|nr:hypothetical protein [Candidatus Rokubacteria bacterium]